MTIQDAQKTVNNWINTVGIRYFNELTNTAILTEEVGEVARLMARIYGEQSFKDPKKEASASEDLADEMADVLFVLICLANQTGIDLEDALQKNLDKKTQRDTERHQQNPKLQKEAKIVAIPKKTTIPPQIKLTPEQIKEIAEGTGMYIYVIEKESWKLHEWPYFEDDYFYQEFFDEDETLKQIYDDYQYNPDKYYSFEKMSSSESFKIMERFARNHHDTTFGQAALNELEKKKPFRRFKDFVFETPYLDEWYAYQQLQREERVIQQLMMELESHDD